MATPLLPRSHARSRRGPRRLAARIAACCAACGALLAPAGAAASPHEHGVAQLDVGVDAGGLVLTLALPLDTAVGFERAPRNDAERARLAAAHAALRDPARWLRIDPAGGCRPAARDATQVAAGTAPGAPAGGHADLAVEWRFDCNAAERAGWLDADLFAAFPRLQRLVVRTATPRGQGRQTLRRGAAPRVTLGARAR